VVAPYAGELPVTQRLHRRDHILVQRCDTDLHIDHFLGSQARHGCGANVVNAQSQFAKTAV
jgi:hypothetical protein